MQSNKKVISKMGDSKLSFNSDNEPPQKKSKRSDYIDWEDYFMATAFLAAKRSKDPVTQVGACIVNNENRIVGIGYNAMPNGNDDEFPWVEDEFVYLERKKFYACHAELNAFINKTTSDVKGCKIYTTLFPCNECAKIIIQSGIKEIIYMSDKYSHKIIYQASKRMLNTVGIKYRKFEPKTNKIEIIFSDS